MSLGLVAGSYGANISFVGNGYVILDIAGAGDTYYDINNQGNDNVTPSYDTDNSSANAFSQTFTINQGQSILLGGQLETFPSVQGSLAFLGYAITDLSGNPISGFNELSLPFFTNAGSNDQFRQLASTSSVELGSTLAPGSYLLSLYEHGSNGGDLYNNEGGTGGNNWEARIVVNAVPEPATIMLLGPALLGGMFFIRRRRA